MNECLKMSKHITEYSNKTVEAFLIMISLLREQIQNPLTMIHSLRHLLSLKIVDRAVNKLNPTAAPY